MTRNVFTLTAHDSVTAAAIVMRRERIGALPIVDGARLVILARSDLLQALISPESGDGHSPPSSFVGFANRRTHAAPLLSGAKTRNARAENAGDFACRLRYAKCT
jgi:CBS-domain-containing membrane protein